MDKRPNIFIRDARNAEESLAIIARDVIINSIGGDRW